MNRQLRANVLLLFTALIWGAAFVAQNAGMDYVGPFTFIAVRYFLGALVLIPVICMRGRRADATPRRNTVAFGFTRADIRGGILCGILLFAASALQQLGIQTTSPGKAGFITSMYILMVPLLGLFLRQRTGINVWIGVALSCAGLYMLCMAGGEGIDEGDIMVIACALGFSFHILAIDHFTPHVDCVRMSMVQFLVAGVIGLPFMLALEQPFFGQLAAGWLPILYTGILSSGVAYTLQVVAQKDTKPAIASLILSLESVFALLTEGVILGSWPSPRELTGCVLMFAAIMTAQFGDKRAAAANDSEQSAANA